MTQRLVLVVEDDDSIITFVRDALVDEGYTVVSTVNGEAVTLAPQLHPDVILLDMMMPGLDGTEVYRRLRAIPDTSRTPIILMSAQVSKWPPDLVVDDCLPKPFDLMELYDVVDRWAPPA